MIFSGIKRRVLDAAGMGSVPRPIRLISRPIRLVDFLQKDVANLSSIAELSARKRRLNVSQVMRQVAKDRDSRTVCGLAV